VPSGKYTILLLSESSTTVDLVAACTQTININGIHRNVCKSDIGAITLAPETISMWIIGSDSCECSAGEGGSKDLAGMLHGKR